METEHEMDTISILRDRCKEYRELLTVAAAMIKNVETHNLPEVFPAIELFLEECEKHGIITKKELERGTRD